MVITFVCTHESWKTNIFCIDGHARYNVSRTYPSCDNTIIGYNTTILAHEYLIEEYRLGEVRIGSNVLIGANTTILPGVTIGDGAIVSAAALINKDVPAGAFVGGNPAKVIYTKEEMEQRKQQKV